jgi:hypothetical protein
MPSVSHEVFMECNWWKVLDIVWLCATLNSHMAQTEYLWMRLRACLPQEESMEQQTTVVQFHVTWYQSIKAILILR